MTMSLNEWIIALAGIAGSGFALWIMHRKRLRSQFPLFFSYLALYTAASLVSIATYLYSCVWYFYVYWALAILLMIVEIGVIYEVLANTLKSYSALVDLAKILFRSAAVFLLLIGLITAAATNGPQLTKLEAATDVVEHSIQLMQCGLLLFLLVFESRLGVSWRNHGMAIAIGMGLYSAVDLTISYLRMLSIGSRTVLETSGGLWAIGVFVFWIAVLAKREPAPKSLLDTPHRLIFQRWNEALMATPLVSRRHQIAMSPIESFLPGVEQTVERVMARKMMH